MRKRGRVGLMAAALVALVASAATAEVTTDQSASILVFPKVIADGTRETVIQITNTSNSMVHAHCFYVNGALTFPDEPPGPFNPPQWVELDFDIWLTKQQPTYWVASQGRLVDPEEYPCSNDPPNYECFNAGFDPGRVPPLVENFTGELKCIEVDASGAPLSGNHLKGEATIVTAQQCDHIEGSRRGICRGSEGQDQCDELENCSEAIYCDVADDCPGTTGDVMKYNALGVIGLETNDGNNVLCLGGPPTDQCPNGAEYNACPQTWILNHLSDGAPDTFLDDIDLRRMLGDAGGAAGRRETPFPVFTDITVVPCAQDFETQIPETVTIQFAITNEFEQPFSASTSVTCWAELNLADINQVFRRDFVGSDYLQTRMRPSSGTNSGFMVVADETHELRLLYAAGEAGGLSNGPILRRVPSAVAAVNVHVEGERPGPDLIVIPAEQTQP